jgi:phosphatidylserine decarboxylase
MMVNLTPSAQTALDELQFLVTNRIPRRWVTRLMGRVSRIEHPVVRDLSLALWQRFADLRLDEAAQTEFKSVHDCFTRSLKPGARTVDSREEIVVSPCDGIVVGVGRIDDTTLIQAKGLTYTLESLVHDARLVERFRHGSYVTLRLTASMYHRFHAPCDLRVKHVTYVSGDTWNTHPVALERVRELYCRNERAILHGEVRGVGLPLLIVPVAAILVASIRLHFLDVLLSLEHRGAHELPCAAELIKGQEMGWFEHGSTIIVIAPPGVAPLEDLTLGRVVRMGEALLRLP